jgi:membrane-associated phospholipid phosphatase
VNYQRRWLWAAAGSLLAFVVLLALVAVDSPVTMLDHAVRDHIVDDGGRPLLGLASDVTTVVSPQLDALVLTAGALAVGWRRRRIGPVVAVALTGWVMALVVVCVKHALGRVGPGLTAPIHGGSFPSGHTASALVCFGALALLVAAEHRRWTRPLLLAVGALTVAIAAALVYADYHWLSDTIGSILLGVALLLPLHRWLRRAA